MIKLVLQRHGESIWNKANIFTGWTDVDLTKKGESEAINAGKLLKKEKYSFDIAFTSVLKRAVETLNLTLIEMGLDIPIRKSWRLNERHYGALQGYNKFKMAKKVGADQVLKWRRSYDTRPPALTKDDPRYPGNDPLYNKLDEKDIPLSECLKDTVARVLPYWNRTIVPELKSGKRVIISAHGNSLRALVKHLDDVSDKDVVALNIPTGIPLVYELDEDMNPIKHYYLGDQDELKKAVEAVKNQAQLK